MRSQRREAAPAHRPPSPRAHRSPIRCSTALGRRSGTAITLAMRYLGWSTAAALALVGCAAFLDVDGYTESSTRTADGDASTPLADGAAGDGTTTTDPCLRADKPVVEVTEITEDATFSCARTYLLKGQVFVPPGKTLTIEPGTTILGQRGLAGDPLAVSLLVVQAGGRIVADGKVDRPIVFTSAAPKGQQKPGDWGGLVILGQARVNQGEKLFEAGDGTSRYTFGGDDDDGDSGVLRYVRLEYGGFTVFQNKEVNGITFAGVGRKTLVDYVQVRMVTDDCFELFGGTVNAKHLLCQYNQDDGIDWDFGYRGKLQFVVVQQDPGIYDDANGFEGDNGGLPAEWDREPQSEPTIANATLCGPGRMPTRPVIDGGAGPLRRRYGMLLRRNTNAHIFNSVVVGFEAGLNAQKPMERSTIELKGNVFFGNGWNPTRAPADLGFAETDGGVDFFADDDDGFDELALATPGNAVADPGIARCFDPRAPSFGPIGELPATAVSDPFFTPAPYKGALRDSRDVWATERWTVWDDK